MSSNWGNQLKLSIFGESHGNGIGVVLDGLPAGIPIDQEEILAQMARRAPGRDLSSTPRKEEDLPEILSGVRNGTLTGAPLATSVLGITAICRCCPGRATPIIPDTSAIRALTTSGAAAIFPGV